MEKIRFILVLFVALLFCNSGYCQEVIIVNSFEELWKMAQKHNPTLEVYSLNIQRASENHKVSKSFLMPTIGATLGGQDNFNLPITVISGDIVGRPDESITTSFGKQYTYNAALALNYTLFDWQKIVTSQSEKNGIEIQKANREYYLQNLKSQTALLYYQTLISMRSMEISCQDTELAKNSLEIARSKFAEESLSLTNLNQAEINYNNVERNVILSEDLYHSNLNDIKILLGLHDSDSIVINGTIPESFQNENIVMGEDKSLATYDLQIKMQNTVLKMKRCPIL